NPVWAVADGQLIAGNPVDSSGHPIAATPVPATVPVACQSPISSTTASGVQFIFGGDSQLSVTGTADAEICGTYQSSRPPVAIFGLKSGTETTTTLSGTSTLKTTSVTSPTFTPASTDALANVENTYATGSY